MAQRAHPIGLLASGLVICLVLGPLIAVGSKANWQGGLSAADWSSLRFTVVQAALSALISVALAVPVARALARQNFAGRGVLITLLGAPFLLPVVVAVMGLVVVFGRSGWISGALGLIGLPPLSIYGIGGVVTAHVFLNLPLATRLILQGWQRVPAERLRLAASLGASIWATVERPMLRQVVPGAVLIVFVICLSSFAVALILGGGPRATTLELAIYQAIRFEFDLGTAALLASLQAALGISAAVTLWRVTVPDVTGNGSRDRVIARWDGSMILDRACIAGAALFLVLPLAAILATGIAGLSEMPLSVWPALGRSVAVALTSTFLCIAIALPVALSRGPLANLAGLLPLSASALVLGTGLFILLRPLVSPGALALPITAAVNALLALPFAVRVLAPAAARAEMDFARLSMALGLRRWAHLKLVVLPRLWAPMGFAAGIAAALSMGDLGVIALFAGPGEETLPLAMYRLMGAYRTDAAAGAALLLVGAALLFFAVLDWGGRRLAAN